MKLEVIQVGNPILRQTARVLTVDEIQSAEIQQLIELMKTTMYSAPGVGLAAPQIGHSLQLIVIEDKEEYQRIFSADELQMRKRKPVAFHVIINPKLTVLSMEHVKFHEGCLSVQGLCGIVPRAAAVKVTGLNDRAEPINIEAEGWYARILQHEVDHLNGVLCIDHMDTKTLATHENYQKFWRS